MLFPLPPQGIIHPGSQHGGAGGGVCPLVVLYAGNQGWPIWILSIPDSVGISSGTNISGRSGSVSVQARSDKKKIRAHSKSILGFILPKFDNIRRYKGNFAPYPAI